VALAVVVGALTGCGAGAPKPATGATRTAATAARRGAGATVGPATATLAASTAGTVTTAGTTTADLPGTGKPVVLLGDMNTPEQFIIGALYEDALSAAGYRVDLSRNIGPTAVSEAAIAEGSLDVYPEYLNVYDSQVAGTRRRFTTVSQALVAGQRYANAHGETLLTPTPFSDTAGIAVLSTFAHAHHLTKLADLRRIEGSLTFGSPLEFSAEPTGLPALERAYRFTPALTTAIDVGDQYNDLKSGTLTAAYVQTTDWQLSEPVYTDLRDTRHVLGFGNVVPVVSSKVLATEGPAFADAINAVDRLLTTSAIRGLQAEMKSAAEPATAAVDVASEFLQGYGIVPPPPWSTVTTTTPLSVTAPLIAPAPLTSTTLVVHRHRRPAGTAP
jgi:glycine betaine/choline ABC-type transport system substrate-binding protein